MPVSNSKRLKASGPIDPLHPFPQWFEDGSGLRLELVTAPDPLAPAMGDLEKPGAQVVFPDNFPDEAFYYMAEARLAVGGNGTVGRARVIMAVEAAFSGDERPAPGLGVVFARFRVRIDDVVPGAEYIVRHPYGETRPLPADERGRVSYTCDLGLAEGNMARVLVTGEIAPFLVWDGGATAGYIGDGVTEHAVVNGPHRNIVEISGPRIGVGSANAVTSDLVRTNLFIVQGRKFGTIPNLPAAGPAGPLLEVLGAEYRTSRAQYRVNGRLLPISIPNAGGFQSNRVDVTLGGQIIGSAFPDATGAWAVRKTLPGDAPPSPDAFLRVRVAAASGPVAERQLIVRN